MDTKSNRDESGTEVPQDHIEVHWQHPRHGEENPVLLVMPGTREEWAAEILDDNSAVVVCRQVLWKDEDGELRKYTEAVDPLDKVPGYVAEALRNYDSNYGPVDGVVNIVEEDDAEPPEEPLMTIQDYFVESDPDAQ